MDGEGTNNRDQRKEWKSKNIIVYGLNEDGKTEMKN